MTRPFLLGITLPGDAAAALHAVPKQQLDAGLAAKAATAHTHASGDITTGTLAPARLPLVPNPPVTLAYAASLTPDASAGNYLVCTLTGACTLNVPTGMADGQLLRIRFIASAANRVVTFVAGLKLTTGLTSTLTVLSGKRGDVGLLNEAGYGVTVLASTAEL